jgi:transposase-like protein
LSARAIDVADFNSLFQLMTAIPDEAAAIAHFTSIRWRNGAFCPRCGSTKVYTFADVKVHKCGDCRQRFSIKVGTIFEGSKIPLRKWLMAVWLLTSHKKGIASTQLARDIEVTQKTAWFMLHRLRQAAITQSFNAPLTGEIEVDETYVGGKEANKPKRQRKGVNGTAGKTAVVGAVSRKGDLIARVVDRTDTRTLEGFVRGVVSKDVTLLSTDEHAGYRNLGRDFPHRVVRHSAGQYVDGRAHTNSIEGAWSLLKRQIYGVHHWVSSKHLSRYVDEMAWRYNRREMAEGGRVNALIAQADGRLTYRALIA